LKNWTSQWGAIIWRVLGILGLFAAMRGDPIYAQTSPDQFNPRVIAPTPKPSTATTTRFAVIGDYGSDGQAEQDVAAMVKSWAPDFIITAGDNSYPSASTLTIDANVGKYYSDYIYPYPGIFTPTATITQNLFFPALGNHDWDGAYGVPSLPYPYTDYFTLNNNERYYDFVWGPVHFFAIDSDAREPDGNTQTSQQAAWLERKLAYSTAKWRVVYLHHPPYSSGQHGSNASSQWPYQSWGATTVIGGHDHDYERIVKNGFPYFVNGVGGNPSLYNFSPTPVSGSAYRYNSSWGAMLVTADDAQIKFQFFVTNTLTALDTYTVTTPATSNRSYLPLIKR